MGKMSKNGENSGVCKVIVVASRKGGVGKTQTAVNLGAGLARQGMRTLIIDTDSQASASVSLGVAAPDKLAASLATVMTAIMEETDFDPLAGIVHHDEGVDPVARQQRVFLRCDRVLPASGGLTAVELSLVPLIGRETILRQYIEMVKTHYDWIIIDTSPSLDLLTVNALAAANTVIIPVAPKFLDAKGVELELKAIAKVQRQINPALVIGGILLTMVDRRAKLTHEVIASIEGAYGGNIHIFSEAVPLSVRAAGAVCRWHTFCASPVGKSIFQYDPNGKVATAYTALTQEVIGLGPFASSTCWPGGHVWVRGVA